MSEKIHFFELDTTVHKEETDENYTVSMGAMTQVGTYNSLINTVNLQLNDKHIKICKDERGSILDAGNMNFYEQAETIEHIFYIDDKKYNMSIVRGNSGHKPDLFSNNNKLDLNLRVLLELNDLNALLNKKDLSSRDLMILEFNLETRQKMPDYLRNFSSFNDLQEKIYEHPDKLQKSTEMMLDLLRHTHSCSECDPEVFTSQENLMKIMGNLRNTNNHKFNMQFKNTVKEIINHYDKKHVHYSKDLKYWHPDDINHKEVIDEIRPLAKMQYSLPKYLTRMRQKFLE